MCLIGTRPQPHYIRPISHVGNPPASQFCEGIVCSATFIESHRTMKTICTLHLKIHRQILGHTESKMSNACLLLCMPSSRLGFCQKTRAVPLRCSPIKHLLNENKSGATENFPSGSIHHFNELRCVCCAQ